MADPIFEVLPVLALLSLVAFVLFRPKPSAVASLSCPPSPSWILGNQAVLMQSEAGVANRNWCRQFGNVYRFQSCFKVEWLMLSDPKAIAHVLQGQTTTYHLDESLREFLRLVTGKGIIYSDGPDHARQRRLLQPSFTPQFVKALTPQFFECANRVSQQWDSLIGKGTSAHVNAYEWAERVTIEVIGQTAFGIRFGAIEGEEHELARAYKGFLTTAFSQPTKFFILLQALMLLLPPWLLALADYIPLKRIQALNTAKATSLAFSRKLIQEKRSQPEGLNEDRHILSTLVKAGEHDGSGKFKRMTEEEIYAQLTTFFVAGYETSCNTLTFALYEIARNPAIQKRLYTEVSEALGDSTTSDTFEYPTLEKMPYLEAVVKETLRLHSVVAHGMFKAGKDNVIPFSKTVTTSNGKKIDSLPVKKGQRVFVSFDGVNRSEDVWGPDAAVFNPERWLDGALDDVSPNHKCGGPYGNLANFGGGPKTCIAWRFAIIELQAFLAVFMNRFHIQIGVPGFQLWRDGCHIVVTPTGKGEKRGAWMPLIVKHRENVGRL